VAGPGLDSAPPEGGLSGRAGAAGRSPGRRGGRGRAGCASWWARSVKTSRMWHWTVRA